MSYATESEALFVEYLNRRHLPFQYEGAPAGANPDFTVTLGGRDVVFVLVLQLPSDSTVGISRPHRRHLKGRSAYVVVLRFSSLTAPNDIVIPGAMFGSLGISIT